MLTFSGQLYIKIYERRKLSLSQYSMSFLIFNSLNTLSNNLFKTLEKAYFVFFTYYRESYKNENNYDEITFYRKIKYCNRKTAMILHKWNNKATWVIICQELFMYILLHMKLTCKYL